MARDAAMTLPPGPRPPAAATLPDESDGATLLQLEDRARRQGSGLGLSELEGLWRFARIWPKGQRQPSPLAGPLLRGLGACLRIEASAGNRPAEANPEEGPQEGDDAPLRLTNAVTLGPLELRFTGPGWLQGRRPLLLFSFHTLQLRAGERVLLERRLPAAAPKRQPFFALIACGASESGKGGGSWLAARGRSGGLALWQRAPGPVLQGGGGHLEDAAEVAAEAG